MDEPLFTREQYKKMHDRQIEIERLMDGLPEGSDESKKLYDEWLNLEYLANQ